MNNQLLAKQNEARYKSGRVSLLLIVILSVVNIFSIVLAERYFLFSAYLPQVLVSLGYGMFFESGESFWLIFMGIVAFVTVFPYLLCWIFSKKHVGWMIAALVFFSLDSLFFLVDFAAYLAAGDYTMIMDLLIRVWALGSLILGVKYGLQKKKGGADAEDVKAEEEIDPADFCRTITVRRKKAVWGYAMPIICYVNGKAVCELKNGETKSFSMTDSAFDLGAMFPNAEVTGSVKIPAGETDAVYDLAIKSGFASSKIVITPAVQQ